MLDAEHTAWHRRRYHVLLTVVGFVGFAILATELETGPQPSSNLKVRAYLWSIRKNEQAKSSEDLCQTRTGSGAFPFSGFFTQRQQFINELAVVSSFQGIAGSKLTQQPSTVSRSSGSQLVLWRLSSTEWPHCNTSLSPTTEVPSQSPAHSRPK